MYEYFWMHSVLEDLAEIYVTLNLEEQDRLSGSIELFNRTLNTDPHDVGESRDRGYCVAFLPFLIVTFHINKATQLVQVIRVRRYGR